MSILKTTSGSVATFHTRSEGWIQRLETSSTMSLQRPMQHLTVGFAIPRQVTCGMRIKMATTFRVLIQNQGSSSNIRSQQETLILDLSTSTDKAEFGSLNSCNRRLAWLIPQEPNKSLRRINYRVHLPEDTRGASLRAGHSCVKRSP